MSTNNLLRRQVVSEVRKKRLIAVTIVILTFLYLSISLVFGDMGLLRYIDLKNTKNKLETEITSLESQNSQLREQINLLREDPFYKEKIAREEFGLARPDEYIFIYDK